jgi:hypothetical protein
LSDGVGVLNDRIDRISDEEGFRVNGEGGAALDNGVPGQLPVASSDWLSGLEAPSVKLLIGADRVDDPEPRALLGRDLSPACSYLQLADCVTACGLIGPLAAFDDASRSDLPQRTRSLMNMAVQRPRLLAGLLSAIRATDQARSVLPGRFGLISMRAFPSPCDRSILRSLDVRSVLTEDSREAMRNGVEGIVDELARQG